MEKTTQYEGRIHFWNDRKKYGIVARQEGPVFIKYFLAIVHIKVCQPAIPAVGDFVKFNVSPIPPRRIQDLPFATDVEIYSQPSGLDVLAGPKTEGGLS